MQPPEERPSKTRLKREMEELQALGKRLVETNDERLASVDLPDLLREAVLEARRIRSHEARRRQLQYIGKLMREVDPVPIRARFAEWDGQSAAATAAHHRAERWRERLLDDESAFTEFARECAGADLQRLRACVREARKDRLAGRTSRHYRELFRLVKSALEARSPPYNPEP
jgi:ribosome-associated protein